MEKKDAGSFTGTWTTRDGFIRQELSQDGRYRESRGKRKDAYQGNYLIDGTHIRYWDDTGFTADGNFRNGALYHGGFIFYKEEK